MSQLNDLSEHEIEIIQESFRALDAELSELVADLYPSFLARYPQYAEYFEETDFREQRKGVEQFFRKSVPNLDEPGSLEATLERLAEVHQRYGVPGKAYEDMGEVFKSLLKKYGGNELDRNLLKAWERLWEGLAHALSGG
jgi:hemoglobin-like flavoprotein